MVDSGCMTRPHRGHPLPSSVAPGGGAIPDAWDDRLRGFRHRAGLFASLDHEATPAAVTSLAIGGGLLVLLAVLEGRAAHPDIGRPTGLAWMAMVCLLAAIAAAADDLLAWFVARPIGRELARAAAAVEGARARVGRLERVAPPEDAALAGLATRLDRAIDHLVGRVDDAARALAAFAGLPAPATRSSRLGLVRDEAHRIVDGADAVDAALHLLLWIEACPWNAARSEAMGRLRIDLEAAERLVSGAARV
jgi:hypothetical protein